MRKSKQLILPLILLAVTLGMVSPTMAADYNFSTDFKSGTFSKSTTSDVPPDYSYIQNVRRDKNSAYFPPSYGIFSGEFATDLTSIYHEQDRNSATITSYNNTAYYAEDTTGSFLTPTSSMTAANSYVSLNAPPSTSNVYTNYVEPQPVITSVSEYTDGSIGRISIPKLNLNVKVYENTDLETMKRGVGHFTFTSQWMGNVGLASHNRGSASYFKCIWNLVNGDKITYTTKAGTRTYYVFNKQKIEETDLSYLTASSENMLSLITCVENQSGYRWLVQARE